MSPTKVPNGVSSFGEKVDIDLAAMTGMSNLTTSTGTLTDEAAHIAFKTSVTIPLTCQRSE